LKMVEKEGITLAGAIPDNDMIYEYDLNGQPTMSLAPDNPAVAAAFAIFDSIVV